MKKSAFYLLLLLALGLLAGCEKGGEEEETMEPIVPIENPGTLLGTWAWEKEYVGGPLSETNPQTPKNTGKYRTLQLCNDSSWIYTENGLESKGEKFAIGRGVYNEEYMFDSICFHTSNQIVRIEYYRLYGNTLDFCFCFKGDATGGVSRWRYIGTNKYE